MSEMSKSLPFRLVEEVEAAIADRIGQLEDILGAMDRTIHGDGKRSLRWCFRAAAYAGEACTSFETIARSLGVLDRLHPLRGRSHTEETKDSRWDLFSEIDGYWRPSGYQEAAKLLRPLPSRRAGYGSAYAATQTRALSHRTDC